MIENVVNQRNRIQKGYDRYTTQRIIRELEDDIACIASIVDSLRKELASVKTEDDAKRFDKRANEANEAFEKLKALQLK